MHDFAISENYAIFLDFPLLLKPENFVKGKIPVGYDNTKGSK